jgi:hypothetical protein
VRHHGRFALDKLDAEGSDGRHGTGAIRLITHRSTDVSKQQQIDTLDEALTALRCATTDLTRQLRGSDRSP